MADLAPVETLDVVVPEAEPKVVVPAPVADDDEGGKPGGDSPQDVRARREYERRKEAEEERTKLRVENARLEERLKAAEQPRKPVAERVYTIAEINAAVAAEKITREDGDRYIEETIIPQRFATEYAKHTTRLQQKAPIEQALKDVNEYQGYVPALRDRGSAEFQKAREAFDYLVDVRGMPANESTEALAVERAFGTLESHRAKAKLASLNAQPRTIPVDGGAGGGGGPTKGAVDISKAPEFMRHVWDRTGTAPEDRESEYRAHLASEARKARR